MPVRTAATGTPTSLTVVVSRGTDRAILTTNSTLSLLDSSAVPADLLAACRHIHVGGYFLLPGLWDRPARAVRPRAFAGRDHIDRPELGPHFGHPSGFDLRRTLGLAVACGSLSTPATGEWERTPGWTPPWPPPASCATRRASAGPAALPEPGNSGDGATAQADSGRDQACQCDHGSGHGPERDAGHDATADRAEALQREDNPCERDQRTSADEYIALPDDCLPPRPQNARPASMPSSSKRPGSRDGSRLCRPAAAVAECLLDHRDQIRVFAQAAQDIRRDAELAARLLDDRLAHAERPRQPLVPLERRR